jgi:hypothetical protein
MAIPGSQSLEVKVGFTSFNEDKRLHSYVVNRMRKTMLDTNGS